MTHTLDSIPLDEGSALRRDLYVSTNNTHKKQTSMPPAVFEPTISASERPRTYPLDPAAPGIGKTQRHQQKRDSAVCNWSTFGIFWLVVTSGTGILCGTVYLYCSVPKGCTLVLRGCELRSVVSLELNFTLIEERVRKLQKSLLVELWNTYWNVHKPLSRDPDMQRSLVFL